MPLVERSALVSHSSERMYGLVNDVDRYQEFLPWCGGSKVLERGDDHMLASVTMAFHGLHKTFVTRNVLSPFEQVSMLLVEGPFETLHGDWYFKHLTESACKIEFKVEYSFANRLLSSLVGPVFKSMCDSMVDSFSQRANSLYHK
jgi:ribosome-associated toxin RatA of RatAB toxin-antitoxin module